MVSQVEEFRTASVSLVTYMQGQLRDVLSSFGATSNPEQVRDTLLQVLPDFMTTYGDTAAVLGADFYEAMRNETVSSGTLRTVFAQPAKTKQSEGAVRWAVGSLFAEEPNWETFQSQLLGAAQRLVLLPARGTIDLLARGDAKSGKVAATSWSRQIHPERAKSHKSCDFCVMLAGRGPVYRSSGAAGAVIGEGVDPSKAFDSDGNRLAGGLGGGVHARGDRVIGSDYHDDCHCVPVPTFYTKEIRTHYVRGFAQQVPTLVPIAA